MGRAHGAAPGGLRLDPHKRPHPAGRRSRRRDHRPGDPRDRSAAPAGHDPYRDRVRLPPGLGVLRGRPCGRPRVPHERGGRDVGSLAQRERLRRRPDDRPRWRHRGRHDGHPGRVHRRRGPLRGGARGRAHQGDLPDGLRERQLAHRDPAPGPAPVALRCGSGLPGIRRLLPRPRLRHARARPALLRRGRAHPGNGPHPSTAARPDRVAGARRAHRLSRRLDAGRQCGARRRRRGPCRPRSAGEARRRADPARLLRAARLDIAPGPRRALHRPQRGRPGARRRGHAEPPARRCLACLRSQRHAGGRRPARSAERAGDRPRRDPPAPRPGSGRTRQPPARWTGRLPVGGPRGRARRRCPAVAGDAGARVTAGGGIGRSGPVAPVLRPRGRRVGGGSRRDPAAGRSRRQRHRRPGRRPQPPGPAGVHRDQSRRHARGPHDPARSADLRHALHHHRARGCPAHRVSGARR